MPQLSLQQYSPAPQKVGPHGSPEGWSGGQYSFDAHLTDSRHTDCSSHCSNTRRTAHDLIARLAHTEILGAWDVIGNADAAALRATGRALDAENRRARVVVNRQADSGAVRAAGGGIAAVARIVDALESVGTRETGYSAAHAARSRDLRGTAPL